MHLSSYVEQYPMRTDEMPKGCMLYLQNVACVPNELLCQSISDHTITSLGPRTSGAHRQP
jgi:hypothetical protein